MGKLRNQIGNPVITFLLRSPLHGLLSRNMLLITVTGRKSGKAYTTPVGYVRVGDEVAIVSSPDRSWWKNLRGGAPVSVRVQGRQLIGAGRVIEKPAEVAADLIELLQAAPQYQKYLGLSLPPAGLPHDRAALSAVARTRVMVKISGLSL